MKKVISAVLACLILLGVIPVGVILMRPVDPGEVFRFMPVYNTYVYQKNVLENGITLGDHYNTENRSTHVGNGKETYMQFRLDSIDKNTRIESVLLRLVALDSNDASVKVNLQLFDNNNWDDSITFATKPEGNDTSIETIVMRATAPTIYEVDITDTVEKLIKRKADSFSLHLTSMDTIAGETVKIASVRNSDPAYRPCLKVITGEAVDTDLDTTQKAETVSAITISSESPDESGFDFTNRNNNLSIGKGAETYLRFKLNHENIQGAIVSAKLYPSSATAADTKIYLMENDSWDDKISYNNRPQGKETLIYQGNKDVYALNEIDLTDVVSDAVEKNYDTVNFHILGGEASSTIFTDTRPELFLHVSDNPEVLAVHNASVNLLGTNYSADSILSDLARDYTASDGTKVHISWTAYDKADKAQRNHNIGYINSYGEVTRPKWFEGNKTLVAEALLRAGETAIKREIELTLPAEAAPVYKANDFDDYIEFGNKESENKQMFESIRVSDSNRGSYTYRTIKKGGSMAFSLACNPEKLCYLTLKLKGNDVGSNALVVENALPDNNDNADGFIIDYAPPVASTNGGFLYVTYPLPESYTKGREFATLRIRGSLSSSMSLSQNSDSRRIYAAYITEKPFFVTTSADNTYTDVKYTPAPIDNYKQRSEITASLKNTLNTLMKSQVYGEENYPPIMEGMQPLSTAWRKKSAKELENWKALYYHSDQTSLKDNGNQFAYLELLACAYKNPKDFDTDTEMREEILNRIIAGIDFFCRSQGQNGGFSSPSNGWIGSPYPTVASYTPKEDYMVISLGRTICDIYPYLAANPLMREYIDSDGDGKAETLRYDAWTQMLVNSRKFLSGSDPDTDVTPLNMSALLTLDTALKAMGSDNLISNADAQRYIMQGTDGAFKQQALMSDNNFSTDTISAISTLAAVAENYGGDGYIECTEILDKAYEVVEHFTFTNEIQEYDYPVLCADGTLFGKNTYSTYVEKYPADIYSAVTLKNNTAKRFLRSYLAHNRIKADSTNMIMGIPDFHVYMLQAINIYRNFDKAISSVQYVNSARTIELWYDAKLGRIVIQNNAERLYIMRTDNDKVKVHYFAPNFEQSAYIQGNVQDDVLTIDYGKYHISINTMENTVTYNIK